MEISIFGLTDESVSREEEVTAAWQGKQKPSQTTCAVMLFFFKKKKEGEASGFQGHAISQFNPDDGFLFDQSCAGRA